MSADVLTIIEWHDARRKGQWLPCMLPRKRKWPAKGELSENVICLTPSLRDALKCLKVMRVHTAVLLNGNPPEAA